MARSVAAFLLVLASAAVVAVGAAGPVAAEEGDSRAAPPRTWIDRKIAVAEMTIGLLREKARYHELAGQTRSARNAIESAERVARELMRDVDDARTDVNEIERLTRALETAQREAELQAQYIATLETILAASGDAAALTRRVAEGSGQRPAATAAPAAAAGAAVDQPAPVAPGVGADQAAPTPPAPPAATAATAPPAAAPAPEAYTYTLAEDGSMILKPLDPSTTTRRFYIDKDGVIRFYGKDHQDAAREALGWIAEAIDTYRSDTGSMPGALSDLLQDPGATGWRGPYARAGAQPFQDPWGHPYFYETTQGALPYRVGSRGADGAPGGSGEDADLIIERAR